MKIFMKPSSDLYRASDQMRCLKRAQETLFRELKVISQAVSFGLERLPVAVMMAD